MWWNKGVQKKTQTALSLWIWLLWLNTKIQRLSLHQHTIRKSQCRPDSKGVRSCTLGEIFHKTFFQFYENTNDLDLEAAHRQPQAALTCVGSFVPGAPCLEQRCKERSSRFIISAAWGTNDGITARNTVLALEVHKTHARKPVCFAAASHRCRVVDCRSQSLRGFLQQLRRSMNICHIRHVPHNEGFPARFPKSNAYNQLKTSGQIRDKSLVFN